MTELFRGQRDYDHKQVPKLGILLTNLGTPDEPTTKALRKYLAEFLWDPRVIEVSRPLWWLILNGIILRTRPKNSAALYRAIWTEEGSPLLLICREQEKKFVARLEEEIGNPIAIALGMRYGNPSIDSALESLRKQGAQKLLVLPLYPQYSASTSASSFDSVADTLKTWRWIPDFRMVMSYHDHPLYIKALANSVREYWEKNGKTEKLLMSFHGIPKRYLYNGDPYHCQCHKTGRLVAKELELSEKEYMVSFQSLFGKEEWLQPYTDKTMESWGKNGVKSVSVMCPGFSADCLETIEEIDEENRAIFLEAGGKEFHYIPALNSRDDFIECLVQISLSNMQGWFTTKDQWDAKKKEEEMAHCQKLVEKSHEHFSQLDMIV